MGNGMSLGIYIHVPYCIRKCRYCDFVSFEKAPEDAYFEKLARNIRSAKNAVDDGMQHYVDTLFFGGLTALVILLSPAGSVSGSYDGAELSIAAYSYFFGGSAVRLLTVLTVFFAFATVLCWGCYGASAVRYLSGGKLCMPYLIIYCSSLVLGAVIPQTAAWHLSDITSSLMLLLNCFCLIKGRKEMK